MNQKLLITSFVLALTAFSVFFNNSQSLKNEVPLSVGLAHQSWMRSLNKIYATPQEQYYRLTVFHQNFKMISDHNSDPESTFTMELNHFADLTFQELKIKYTGGVADQPEPEESEFFVPDPNQQIPEAIDYRKWSPPVLNQEQCGSCWIFSSAAVAEISFNKSQGTMFQFSPQQVLDCIDAGKGCQGGPPYTVGNYYRLENAALHSEYPYVAVQNSCDLTKRKTVIPKALTTVIVKKGSYENYISAVVAGPVTFQMYIPQKLFYYKGGILTQKDCYDSMSNSLHAMAIVGYTPEYWIIRNSWGSAWGEQGYPKPQTPNPKPQTPNPKPLKV